MKGQKILKVTSILMIIGGVIAVVVGVLAILGISALAALSGSTEGIGLLYASSILVTVASVIQFIAGIKGIGACSDSQKAASCIKWGRLQRLPEGSFLHQVGHYHCNFDHHLYDHRPGGRRNLQHYQPGAQPAAAGALCLWRRAGKEQHHRLI